ncbi:MAG: hypothetical protein Wins2KO_21220 [Winogradskyella sp.]
MSPRLYKILFPILIAITLFSLWAGFALLVVNKFFYQDLNGYTIGRICIWEYVAIAIAIIITRFLIRKWGNIELNTINNKKVLTLNPNYGVYFGVYFCIAIMVAVWQFWLFSQKF